MQRTILHILLVIQLIFIPCSIRSNIIQVYGEGYVQKNAECVIEAESGRILYLERGDVRLPMASTTKILTAATVLDCCKNIKEIVTIPHEAVGVEGSSVYLKVGERYTIEELLYGLLLRSGNDCAMALAYRFGGTMKQFSSKMNAIAQKAGALQSHFSNPHGLPTQNHYTTARDLCYITRYAMKNPIFRNIVSTQYFEPRGWKNKNKLLYEYEGAIGVKTGYTKEAGRCLVSAATRDNMTLIATVLNCQAMYERSMKILNDAYQCYVRKCIIKKGTTLSFSFNGEQKFGLVKEDFYYPLSDGEESHVEIKTIPLKWAKNSEIIGQFQIYLSKRLLFSGNLYKL